MKMKISWYSPLNESVFPPWLVEKIYTLKCIKIVPWNFIWTLIHRSFFSFLLTPWTNMTLEHIFETKTTFWKHSALKYSALECCYTILLGSSLHLGPPVLDPLAVLFLEALLHQVLWREQEPLRYMHLPTIIQFKSLIFLCSCWEWLFVNCLCSYNI